MPGLLCNGEVQKGHGMNLADIETADLPQLADYLASRLLGLRDWCPRCQGTGLMSQADSPKDSNKATTCDRCEGHMWFGALDLERLLVNLSHHRRQLTIILGLTNDDAGVVVWSATEKQTGTCVAEGPLQAAYRLAAKIVFDLESQGGFGNIVDEPTDPDH